MTGKYEMRVYLDGIRQNKAYYADSVERFAPAVAYFTKYLKERFGYEIRTTNTVR